MLTEATARNLARKAHWADQVQLLPDGTPLFSWIDCSITDLCNRACVFCPRVDPSIYPNQHLHMPVTLARKIGAELRALRYQGAVVLCGFGEPLLHPEVIDVVRALAMDDHGGSKIRVEVVTNGDRLTAPLVRDLIAAGLGYFVVSAYDGPEQIEKFDAIFADAGCTDYVVRDRWYGADSDFGLKLTNRAGTVTIGQQIDVDNLRSHPCMYLTYMIQVDWNGDILLCPQDWHKRVRFGSVAHQSLVEVWTSAAMHKRRKRLLRGRNGMSPCDTCNADGTLHGFNHATGWQSKRVG